MSVTATGAISVNLQKLVDLVAASTNFRSRIHANAGDAEAREHIHWPHADRSLWELAQPLAVIESGGLDYSKLSGGALNWLKPHVKLVLTLTDHDRYEDSTKDSQTDFENYIAAVLSDVIASSGSDDNLSVVSIRQTMVAARTHPADVPSQPNGRAFWMAQWELTCAWV